MINRTLIIVFALTFITAYISEAAFVLDGLVSYWDFESISGGKVEDLVGDHDGVIEGNVVAAEGRDGNALEFDGSGAYVNVDDPEGFDFETQDYTWLAWIKTSAGGGCIIAKTPCGNADHAPGAKHFFITGGNLTYDAGWVAGFTALTVVNDGEWHYVGVTMSIDISGTTDTAQMYVDGEPDASSDNDWNSQQAAADQCVKIGYLNDNELGWTPAFNGIIDEVAIYDRALEEDEVSDNFKAEVASFAVEPAEKLAGTWGAIKASR